MSTHKVFLLFLAGIIVSVGFIVFNRGQLNIEKIPAILSSNQTIVTPTPKFIHPLQIEYMKKQEYLGSDIVIEETLPEGSNYNRYVVFYKSDELKIYALLTVPQGEKPQSGWPVIIFNHGYIPPEEYRTTERYVQYTDAFSRDGYIVFKSDYRGNGSSQGAPEGAYYSPSYSIDILNAISSVKRYKDADPNRIGMWGHSMGGNITLRNIVVRPDAIKAAVIWGGVVGSYDDLMNNWQRKVPYQPSARELAQRNTNRKKMTEEFGNPVTNPMFWESIDPTYHLQDITTPIQLHAGEEDEEVPAAFSAKLYEKLQKAGKVAEYYNYPGGDHNISSPNFEVAIQRSVEFFNRYLKK
jgi:dipeptidyl aminopeptidase/acylaminoacyl peptidase